MSVLDDAFDFLFKIVLVGDAGVGKSALLLRFADEIFNETYINTIGVDFRIRTIKVDGKQIKLQIWDTAGQERFRNITASFYRGSHGILLAFDLTHKETFARVNRWLTEVKSSTDKGIVKFLVGTKSDMDTRREVPVETAKAYAKEMEMNYVETSAKNNINVDEVFFHISREILKRISTGLLDVGEKKPLLGKSHTIETETEFQSSCCSKNRKGNRKNK